MHMYLYTHTHIYIQVSVMLKCTGSRIRLTVQHSSLKWE